MILDALSSEWELFPGAYAILHPFDGLEEVGRMKLDLAGVLMLIQQIQNYESGTAVSIPLDLTAQFGPKATGSVTLKKDAQNRLNWSISIGAAL